jgi:hypothetical protein
LAKVTVALATRAPEGSETPPENEAEEAKVWPYATGNIVLVVKAVIARIMDRKRLRKLGFDMESL